MTKWLDEKQAAEYTRISTSTLSKKRLTGDGPVYAKVSGRCIYAVEDLDNWISQHKRSSTSGNHGA